MSLMSKKTSLVILGITALICSRVMFVFFNDPEGPNLVVVVGMAAILYSLSLMAQALIPATSGSKKLLVAIAAQMLVAAVLYLFLK
jgi:hypothetical protein